MALHQVHRLKQQVGSAAEELRLQSEQLHLFVPRVDRSRESGWDAYQEN